MSLTPYTQKRLVEHRGPIHSDDYNLRVEETYRDMVYLYNRAAQIGNESSYSFTALFKQLMSMNGMIDKIETRVSALEDGANSLVFYSHDQIDVERFNSTAFEVSEVDQCSYNSQSNILTLPKVANSSVSKIRFINSDGTLNIASGLETLVTPTGAGVDNPNSVIESSQPYDAILAKPGRVWERNVMSTYVNAAGAECYLYVRIPNDLSITSQTNCVMLTPYPIFDVDITEIAYSTNPNVALSAISTWTPINSDQIYFNNDEAVGFLPPGGWLGDEILSSGNKVFYFNPQSVSAIRIKLKQNSYYADNATYVYSYGLSKIDIRYDKFISTGKTIVRLDAPNGDTISSVNSVTPRIWNVAQSIVPDAFSYRIIWETSPDSGTYTLTPVPLSERIWLEITLNQLDPGYTPSLSSIVVNYTS